MRRSIDYISSAMVRPRGRNTCCARHIHGILVNQIGEPQPGRLISAAGGSMAITRDDGTFSIPVYSNISSLIIDEDETYKGIRRRVDHIGDFQRLVLHVKHYEPVDIDRLTVNADEALDVPTY